MRFLRAAAIAAALVFLGVASPAFAQAVASPATTVNFDPFIAEIMPYVLALASAVIAAGVAWITRKVHQWTGINIEAKHREALQSALTNGARAAIGRYTPGGVAFDMKSVPIKLGVDFVLHSVPDAVKHFGLSEADIEKHLMPKLVAMVGGK
jgi:hypothetical protein